MASIGVMIYAVPIESFKHLMLAFPLMNISFWILLLAEWIDDIE